MSDQAAPARPLPELKSTAYLMLLDAGLFCVSPAAGTPSPDAVSGLPAVRLSHAPAPGRLGGSVTIRGFDGDGWLGARDDAVLVRVSGGPAQVLVTFYQAAAGDGEAPRLQVLRLSERLPATEPAMGPATGAAAEPAMGAPVEVVAHFYGRGDVAGSFGEWTGERGSRRWVEGFALKPLSGVPAEDIEYQAVLGRGWMSPWAQGGQFCGSRGMSLPILGLRVRLRGESAKTLGLAVSATFVDGSEIGPVVDGAACEAPSLAALEAFRVVLSPRPAAAKPARRRGTK